MHISDEVRSALTAGRLAHFTTLNADGSPHTVLVWVGVDSGPDGDQVVIGKLGEDKKVRNIRRDPRVSFSVEAAGDTNGLGHYLVVEGTAEIDPTGGRELLAELSQTYLGRTPTSRRPCRRARRSWSSGSRPGRFAAWGLGGSRNGTGADKRP